VTVAPPIARFAGTRFVPLALRNLLANKRRLVRSSAGIGFAVLLMLVQLGFERGFFDASLATVRQLDGDLVIMSASKYAFGSADPFPPGILETASKVAGIASVAPLFASWQEFLWKDPTGDRVYPVQAFGFDPDRPVFLLPEVRAQAVRLKEEDTVIVDRLARDFLGMASGACPACPAICAGALELAGSKPGSAAAPAACAPGAARAVPPFAAAIGVVRRRIIGRTTSRITRSAVIERIRTCASLNQISESRPKGGRAGAEVSEPVSISAKRMFVTCTTSPRFSSKPTAERTSCEMLFMSAALRGA